MRLTPLELDIMKVVWHRRPVTVRDVQNALHPYRPLAYTTVMTIMDRLFHKGFLTRTLESRSHVYEPVVSYSEARGEALKTLIESFFDGSSSNLEMYLRREDPSIVQNSSTEAAKRKSFDETLL